MWDLSVQIHLYGKQSTLFVSLILTFHFLHDKVKNKDKSKDFSLKKPWFYL